MVYSQVASFSLFIYLLIFFFATRRIELKNYILLAEFSMSRETQWKIQKPCFFFNLLLKRSFHKNPSVNHHLYDWSAGWTKEGHEESLLELINNEIEQTSSIIHFLWKFYSVFLILL